MSESNQHKRVVWSGLVQHHRYGYTVQGMSHSMHAHACMPSNTHLPDTSTLSANFEQSPIWVLFLVWGGEKKIPVQYMANWNTIQLCIQFQKLGSAVRILPTYLLKNVTQKKKKTGVNIVLKSYHSTNHGELFDCFNWYQTVHVWDVLLCVYTYRKKLLHNYQYNLTHDTDAVFFTFLWHLN